MPGKSNTNGSQKVSKTASKKELKEEVEVQGQAEKSKKETKKNVAKTSKKSEKKADNKNVEKENEEHVEQAVENKFRPQLTLIQAEVKTVREYLQTLTGNLKKLESCYKYDIKKVKKHKQKRNGPHKPTGFAKPQAVPDKLAKFIGVKSGEELTGPVITSKVWQQLKERGLTYEKDKRVFRTDKTVSDLFGVNTSVNKSTDHRDKTGFNFCNLQKYIAHALGKEDKEKAKVN